MTCTSNTKAYIKIGDSFDVPVQMVDSTTGLGVEITPSMSFSCSIINLLGEVIATPTGIEREDLYIFKDYFIEYTTCLRVIIKILS